MVIYRNIVISPAVYCFKVIFHVKLPSVFVDFSEDCELSPGYSKSRSRVHAASEKKMVDPEAFLPEILNWGRASHLDA